MGVLVSTACFVLDNKSEGTKQSREEAKSDDDVTSTVRSNG